MKTVIDLTVNKALTRINERLISEVVFLTKQVSDRDIVIRRLQELAGLETEED